MKNFSLCETEDHYVMSLIEKLRINTLFISAVSNVSAF